jgi:hypothetical protein
MSAVPPYEVDWIKWARGGYSGPGSNPLPASPSDQFLRRWSLVLGTGTPGTAPAGDSLVLSTSDEGLDPRIKFEVRQADNQTPNTAIIRCYNLADTTALKAVTEFTRVVLSAGYMTGRFGVIFDGNIKQFKKGRESTTETYLDIFAADGDLAYNTASISQTIAAGSTSEERFKALQKAWADAGLQTPPNAFDLKEQILPRDRVYWGMTADETQWFAKSHDATWNITNGKFVLTPNTAYASGDIVVLTSQTGMIGFPEATQDGVMVTCLLNPSIQLRQRIKLDNKSINFYFAPGGSPTGESGVIFPGYAGGVNYFASPATDGIYCALVIDYSGDSRGYAGSPWYNIMTCLSVDPSSGQGSSVKSLG